MTTIANFSDTHNRHPHIILPECDISIFSGDFSGRGSVSNTEDFLDWYASQRQCKHKIMIAGNHDLCFDPRFEDETGASRWLQKLMKEYPEIIYLENSSVELEGLKIWGSPITPDFHPKYWAFNKPRGEEIQKVWDTIPTDTDIIVTHGPVHGAGDYIPNQMFHAGCEDLKRTIRKVKPILHVCGHIHEGYGKVYDSIDNILFVNASICNEDYKPINPPILIEIEDKVIVNI